MKNKLNINYVTPVGDEFASFRYRIRIPSSVMLWQSQYTDKSHVDNNADINVFSKHWDSDVERIRSCETKTVFDVCDDHFDREKGDHYRAMINHANVVTCNSENMRKRIIEVTGRDAIVIEDPIETFPQFARFQPSGVPRLCWFGSPTNINTLSGLSFPGLLEVVSAYNKPGIDKGLIFTPWSPKAVERAVERSDVVIIPKVKPCASANRAIEAINLGRFVVATGISEAYRKLSDFIYLGDTISDGVDWALNHPKLVQEKIFHGQQFVRQAYSREAIARKWLNLFESI